jgi:hypothetical protein
MNQDQIKKFLKRMGNAVSAGDLSEISKCFALPALVLMEDGALAISQAAEIEKFFGQAVAQYRSQGILTTKAELEHSERLSQRLSAVDVRWPGFDAASIEKYSERSHYLLWLDDDGQPRIRVALSRTVR